MLIALACEPADEGGRSTPSLREITDRAERQGILVSRGHLHHILKAGVVHPHRVQQGMHSPGPRFREKVNEICDLYRKPPDGGAVLSMGSALHQ